jgi:dephospho-CoA kinase
VPILGITGGIATGKSSFTGFLKSLLPAEVFSADECARELTSSDAAIKQAIIAEFGKQVEARSEINRERLREIVFADPEKRKQLEAILHPAIRARWSRLAAKNREARSKDWLFVDIPLLFETGAEEMFDEIVVVACSAETQRQRLLHLRRLATEMAVRIIASQMDLKLKIEKAGHVVWNNSTLAHLEAQAGIFANYLRRRHG